MVDGTNIAPYAPLKSVIEVIRRKRERGLPETITNEVLHSIGVAEGNAPRTLQALKWLHLVEEDGLQSQLMSRLGKATSEEYPVVMAEMIRGAYQAVFTLVDPSKDDENKIQDAFRQHQPSAQRSRMVALFLGLCQESGIIEKVSRKKKAGITKAVESQRAKQLPLNTSQPAAKDVSTANSFGSKSGTKLVDYRAVSAIMQLLPVEGKWTKDKREKWIQALTAAVDFTVDVIEPDSKTLGEGTVIVPQGSNA